jgi:hypothetical protein
MPLRRDALAFDRASVRRIDQDGRMHVEVANISKANVCPYRGSEIPGYEALGLDANRIYQLLRDPAELTIAAETFNNIPVLSRHVPITVSDYDPKLIVGSTGTDAAFAAPYLRNSLVIWDAAAIARIETDEQRELSCAYRYDPDMMPGSYDGTPYDGVMRNIRGNHVALVSDGRAGSDVIVGDEALNPHNPTPQENADMAAKAAPLSRQALFASGALIAYLRPKLAQDAKIDVRGMLTGITSANWKTRKPGLITAVTAAAKGKLAQDADIADIAAIIEAVENADLTATDTLDDKPKSAIVEPPAKDADPIERLMAFLKDKLGDDDLNTCREMLQADDEDDSANPMKPAAGKDPDEPGVAKAAMDAAIAGAIKTATEATMARLGAVRDAERFVRPWIGELAIAQDSADAVYRLALDSLGVKSEGVHPSAFRAILEAQPKPGDRPKKAAMAHDAAPAAGFATRHPDAARIKIA